MIPIRDLSVLNPPPGQWIVAVLKAYFDNSGEEINSQHQVCSLAGYITTVEKWQKFEELWGKALSDNKVPYLHMKEFAHNIGPFEKFKYNENDRRLFLQSLIKIMKDVNLEGIASIIRLNDLNQFNIDNNTSIEAFPLNLYTSLAIMSRCWGKEIIEAIIDKIDKPHKEIDKARRYAETDVYIKSIANKIEIYPLEKCLSFKEIMPLQAADLLAWEARKDIDTKNEWFNINPDIGENVKKTFNSLKDWCEQKELNYPYQRQSLSLLIRNIRTIGIVWNYNQLCHLHKARKSIWPH